MGRGQRGGSPSGQSGRHSCFSTPGIPGLVHSWEGQGDVFGVLSSLHIQPLAPEEPPQFCCLMSLCLFIFPSSLLPVQLQLCLEDSHGREQSAEPCFPVFVCLERLTPPGACLLCLTLLEAQIPYQPFPQDSLTLFSPNEGLRQWGPRCIFWQPPLWSCSISFLLWVNQIKQISLDYPQRSLVLPLLGEQILSGTGGIFMARQNTFSRASLFLCRD